MIIVTEPVGSDLSDVVLRLGGFHTEMSFLGCIGHLMAASGLQKLLELIYAPNAVVHMLTGKAVARALIVDAALNALVLAKTFNVPLPGSEDETTENVIQTATSSTTEVDEAAALYEKLVQGSMTADQVCQEYVMTRINDSLQREVNSLKSSRTATLWLQYMDMVSILRKYIQAERTGNWELHLQAVFEMLPYVAASGHNNYTKSAWVYLQRMSNLQDEYPHVYEHFVNGLHVVRRSDRYWAGLYSDLVIEQVLMRSMKTSGGLT